MKAENARFDYSREIQIENKKSVVEKEKRKMSEIERIKEEAEADVITISRAEFLSISAEQSAPGSKLAELIEKNPALMLLHMFIALDLADKLFRKKEEEKESEKCSTQKQN